VPLDSILERASGARPAEAASARLPARGEALAGRVVTAPPEAGLTDRAERLRARAERLRAAEL
jgi:hypothetical protein